jgi:manganese/zinc/iron transport system substrate-binding protein
MMLPRLLLASCLLLLGTAFAQLKVVTTIGMIADLTSEIGGEFVSVTPLMGAGIDPHLYRATARDVQTLQGAELILYSGYSLEGQLAEVLQRFSEFKPTVAVAERGIPADLLITVSGTTSVDPHVWMDASLWNRTVGVIRDVLSELDPAHAGQFSANAELLSRELLALHEWVAQSTATIPAAQRILVTAHDAFSYYGRVYGMEVEGIQGISTDNEAAVADIRATVNLIVRQQIPALFVESTINPRTVRSVLEAVARQGHSVEIGGELYSDAMGMTGTAAGTYIGMIFANTRTITEALGGEVPELPAELHAWAGRWNLAP